MHTFGKGVDGAVEYHTNVLKNYINENNFILKRSMAKIGIDVAQDFIPTPGLSAVMDFASDMNNDYNARILAENIIKVELATTTDSYVTQIDDECVIRFGPNTEAVMRYMDNKGYPLKGSMKENIDNMIKYGKDINRNSTVQIRDHIIKELREGGYKWID